MVVVVVVVVCTGGVRPDVKPVCNENAPRLTGEGYECIPSIRDLQEMTDEQLSKVDNFEVRHKKFGRIVFGASFWSLFSLSLSLA